MRLLRTLPLLLCLAALPLPAQYVVGKVVFSGAASYPEADLLQMAALKKGDPMTRAGLQEAAGRLVNSGYFEDVQATLDGPFKSVEARFKLTPVAPAKLYPATFRNFVWLTPDELAAFEKSIPLLSFGVPEAGTQQGAIQTALEALLAQKSVAATLSHELIEPSTGHPHRVFEYRVETPDIRLRNISLAVVAVEPGAAERAKLLRAEGAPYNEGTAGRTVSDVVLEPWLNAGYIDAHLEDVSRTIAPGGTAARVNVDLKAKLIAGEPYRVSSLTFAGTPVEPTDAFAKTARLHPNDIASRRDLLASLYPVTLAYHSHGYMDAVVDATAAPDAAAHKVAYTVTVVPGEQYKLRTVTVNGLPASVRPDFDATFTLKPGDVYDESYVGTFLVHNHNVRSLQGFNGAFTALADPETHLLDLTINFVPGNSITVH
jgi:outer membrane protein insertion porin family